MCFLETLVLQRSIFNKCGFIRTTLFIMRRVFYIEVSLLDTKLFRPL